MSSCDHAVVLLVNVLGEAERVMDASPGPAHAVQVYPSLPEARARLHEMMKGDLTAFASCEAPGAYTGMRHRQQTVFFDEVRKSPLECLEDIGMPILLAGAVPVPSTPTTEKRLALFVWQMHPNQPNHPHVACVFVSTDEAAVLARFVQTIEAQSQIPWGEWRVFDAYCFDGIDSPAWRARGEPFELDERYWLKDWGFLMTEIDPLLADEAFQGWQGCCIAELHG